VLWHYELLKDSQTLYQEFIIYIKERISSCLYCHGEPCVKWLHNKFIKQRVYLTSTLSTPIITYQQFSIIKITLKVKIWSKEHLDFDSGYFIQVIPGAGYFLLYIYYELLTILCMDYILYIKNPFLLYKIGCLLHIGGWDYIYFQ